MTVTGTLKVGAAVHIDLAQEALSFEAPVAEPYGLVENAFTAEVKKKWDLALARLGEINPALYESWKQKVAELSADGFNAFFLKPEFTDKLLNYKPRYFERVVLQMDGYLDAELAKVKGTFDTEKYKRLWTCNGDYLLRYDAATGRFTDFESFRFSDNTCMDFFSPACQDDNKEDIDREQHVKVVAYSVDEALAICNRMMECYDPLEEQFPAALQLIDRCTDVIIMKKFSGDEYFYSSSNGAYIGASFLINPHIASPEMIVNALVHEATHALVLKIDLCNPWMPRADDPNTSRHINSHWTGRPLPLRSYLQAQFVWFGLFNFWKKALENGIFNRQYALQRIKEIHQGFCKAQPSMLRDYGLADDVTETISTMKEQVLLDGM
jgi:hypothetical protein